jgi:hypothetical protein
MEIWTQSILKLWLAVLVASACVRPGPETSAASVATAECPGRASDTAAFVINAKAHLVTVLIDGRLALWNYQVLENSEAPLPYRPPLRPSEIKSVQFVEAIEARRLYGTCPGVPVFFIETKSGSWHPTTSNSRR